MNIIDGNQIAESILAEVKQELALMEIKPKLQIILATQDAAAQKYTKLKQKKCADIGIDCQILEQPEQVSVTDLIELIRSLEGGVMVQLPLYPHLQANQSEILNSIPANQDVDGLSSRNLGLLVQGSTRATMPATVAAILEALEVPAQSENLALTDWLTGKHAVIVNHSSLIGKPLSACLLNHNTTVTVAHKHTTNLAELTRQADILITAAGTPGLINADMLKQEAVVIDVTSLQTDAGIKGDVIIDSNLEAKVSWITPVPGGIGPVTIACLLRNLVI
jgi:methylenetetrahydrofolate dehydrogenase (NADP+)/methenyltetrahydrofolate cyclohydrolase